MECMITLILIIVISIWCIKRKQASLSGGNIRSYTGKAANSKVNNKAKNKADNAAYKKAVSQSLSHSEAERKAVLSHGMLKDDVNNDWLAQQLKAEHIAFKNTSDMFNLKIEHVSACDAQYLKQFHHAHCDANKVDSGKGK